MAHLIESIAYTGSTPWHGLGVSLPSDASIDQWRIAAGLEWEAVKRVEAFKNAQGSYTETKDFILARSDTGVKLGNVTRRYQPVQPKDVVEFYRDLCNDYDFTIETMGSLDEGKRIWALAKTGDEFSIMGQDKIGSYLLLATSYDGTMATRAMFTSVRVVCQNTLSMANKSSKGAISVPHSTTFDHNAVKIDLGIYQDNLQQFQNNVDKLANISVNRAKAMEFIFNVMRDKEPELEACSTRKLNIIQNIYNLYAGQGMGANLRSSSNTAWGLVNAVTQFVDHEQGNNANNRFKAAQFGVGATLKEKAFNDALLMAA